MVSTDSPGELPYKVDDPGQYRVDLSDMAIPIKPGIEPKTEQPNRFHEVLRYVLS